MHRMMLYGAMNRTIFIQSLMAKRYADPATRAEFDRAFVADMSARLRPIEDELIDLLDTLGAK